MVENIGTLILFIFLSFLIFNQLNFSRHLREDGRKLWETFFEISKETNFRIQENTFSGYRLPDLLGKINGRLMLVHPGGKYTMMMIQSDLNLDIEGEINIKKKGKRFIGTISMLKKEKAHLWDSQMEEYDILADSKKLASKTPSLVQPIKDLFHSIKNLERSIDGELFLVKITNSELTIIWNNWIYDKSKIEHFVNVINEASFKLEEVGGERPTNKKPESIEKALNPTSTNQSFETGMMYLLACMGFLVIGLSSYIFITSMDIISTIIVFIIGIFILFLSIPRIYIKKTIIPNYIELKKTKKLYNKFFIFASAYMYMLFGVNLLLLSFDYLEGGYIFSIIEVLGATIILARASSPTASSFEKLKWTEKYDTNLNKLFMGLGTILLIASLIGLLGPFIFKVKIPYFYYATFSINQLIALFFVGVSLRWKRIIAKRDGIVWLEGFANLIKLKQKIPYEQIKGVAQKDRIELLNIYGLVFYPPRDKSGLLGTDYSDKFWRQNIEGEEIFLENIEEDKWMKWDEFTRLDKRARRKNADNIFQNL